MTGQKTPVPHCNGCCVRPEPVWSLLRKENFVTSALRRTTIALQSSLLTVIKELFQYRECLWMNKTATYVKSNMKALWSYHCCRGKAKIIAYSECVSVMLFIQNVIRMRHIILTFVVCPTVPYFCTLFHKGQEFRGGKKVIGHQKCVSIFFTIFV